MTAITIDRQQDKRKWVMWAFKADGTAAIVEYGACLGDQELLEALDEPKSHTGHRLICLADPNRKLILEWGLYDSRYEPTRVYETCIASGFRIFPSMGAGGISTGGRLIEGKPEYYEGQSFYRYVYHDYALKVHFYNWKIAKRSEPRLYLPDDVGDEFVVELLSESLGPKKLSSNTSIMEWHHDTKIGPNDWGDGGKMGYAMWQIMGPNLQRLNPPLKPESPVLAAIAKAKAALTVAPRGMIGSKP